MATRTVTPVRHAAQLVLLHLDAHVVVVDKPSVSSCTARTADRARKRCSSACAISSGDASTPCTASTA
jgi:hypothetical protein